MRLAVAIGAQGDGVLGGVGAVFGKGDAVVHLKIGGAIGAAREGGGFGASLAEAAGPVQNLGHDIHVAQVDGGGDGSGLRDRVGGGKPGGARGGGAGEGEAQVVGGLDEVGGKGGQVFRGGD